MILAAGVIAGSLLGVLTNAWLASRNVLLPAPLTTPRMAATAFDQLAAGPSAMMHQAFSGTTGAWTANLDGGTGRLATVKPVSSLATTALRRLPDNRGRRFHCRALGDYRRVVLAAADRLSR